MAQTYKYSILNDFPNQEVNHNKLSKEIIDSTAVIGILEGVTTELDDCYIVFQDVLPSAEETALDVIVAAHDGVSTPLDDFGLPVAQTESEKEEYKAFAQSLFNNHPHYRKVFKALLRELLTEFNRSKNPKAQMSIVNGNNAQLMTSKTWEQITTFSLEDGRDSESFDTLSVDLTNSKIVSTVRGRHYCSFDITAEGDANSEFLFEIAVNGDNNADIRGRLRIGADAGDQRQTSASGFVAFPIEPPGTNEITLLCRNFEDDDRNLTIIECQITVFRLENNVGRNLGEMITKIDGQFDKDD